MYYATFKENGERITTYIIDINCDEPPVDSILITKEDQQLYCDGSHIRDMETGFPILRPIPLPTLDDQISAIEEKYNIKFKTLQKRLGSVLLSNGLDKNAKITIIQNEYKELSDQKDLEILNLFGGV